MTEKEVPHLPIATEPTPTPPERMAAEAPTTEAAPLNGPDDLAAAQTLVRHLFAGATQRIDGLEYDVAYHLAEKTVGGDIVDVFHFDNGNAAFAIADISGKGTSAAVSAAMVKYGLRAFVSQGLTAERVLRSLDRLFLESNAFERSDSFASVFLAIIDDSRQALTYTSAGHEPVVLVTPSGAVRVLEPTAPLVGVFDDQHHLFRQRLVELEPGSAIVATTDGVTEARSVDGVFFGMDRFVATVSAHASDPISDVPRAIIDAVAGFTGGRFHDDIAVFAVRISPK